MTDLALKPKRNPLAAPHTNVAGLVVRPHAGGVEIVIDAVFGAPFPLLVLSLAEAETLASRLLDLSLAHYLTSARR